MKKKKSLLINIKSLSKDLTLASLTSVFTLGLLIFFLKMSLPTVFNETILSGFYEGYTEKYKDDPLILNITNKCGSFETEYDKVVCVNSFFKEHFVFTDDKHLGLNSPSKTFIDGGVCRESAVIYCTIFKNLGLECNYVFEYNRHVMANVWIDNINADWCILDQTKMTCENGTR